MGATELLRVSTPGLELSDKSTHWHEEQSRDETEIPALMEVTREVRKSTAAVSWLWAGRIAYVKLQHHPAAKGTEQLAGMAGDRRAHAGAAEEGGGVQESS
ncbi:hypothetical protein CB1_000083012 [Camelus ferus]|nr:hypothetical protein CB1_000083012 [Camelus ferus]